jgi:hypothetical protein
MMKALLLCSTQENIWSRQFFPNHPVYLLPFANKPAIEYILDYCFLCGIRDIRIICDEESEALRAQYRNGEMLSMNIEFGSMSSTRSLKRIILQNKAFCKDCDLLIFSGLFLPEYDKRKPLELSIGPNEMKGCSYGNGGTAWYLIGRDRQNELANDLSTFHDEAPVSGQPVKDILDYYRHNMRLAGSDIGKYNLPGFSEGKKSFVGRDVQIASSARVRPPVILGNGIQFGRGVHAGPNIIIGDNCIIDNRTTIRDTIVLGNTYIGQDLEISGKICFGNTIIDPVTGTAISPSNPSVVSEMEPDEYGKCPVHQKILAAILLLFQTLPYVLLMPFLEFHFSLAECLTGTGRKRTMAMYGYALPRDSFAGKMFRRLTLNKYHLLPYAAVGKMRLVGNCLLEATEHNERFIRDLPGYAPGVFSYSEYLGHENEPYQLELDEQYYAYAMNCWFNIKILTGILRHNLSRKSRSLQQRGATE